MDCAYLWKFSVLTAARTTITLYYLDLPLTLAYITVISYNKLLEHRCTVLVATGDTGMCVYPNKNNMFCQSNRCYIHTTVLQQQIYLCQDLVALKRSLLFPYHCRTDYGSCGLQY